MEYEEFKESEELEVSEESQEDLGFDQDSDQIETDPEQEMEESIESDILQSTAEPVQVDFSLLVDSVSFDTELNDLGFASVAICICLFVMFLSLGWRFEDR